MTDLLRFAGWIAPLEGRPLRPGVLGAEDPLPGEVLVTGESRAFPPHLRVQRFLRFPGTSGGFVLLDAQENPVFRAGIRLLPHGRRLTRLASRLVRVSASLGMARGLASGQILLVSRAEPPPRPLCERFEGLPADLAWNVSSGVAGRSPRTTVQLAARDGRIAAYARIAHDEASRDLVANEADVLRRLAALGVPAPRCLGLEAGAQGTLLVQTALEGRRWHGAFGVPQARFLARLERATARRQRLCDTTSHRNAMARLAALEGRDEREEWELWRDLAQILETAAGDQLLPCSMAHGDFTDWNSVVAGGEALAFDWEHARESAPRLHDAFHFVLQQAVLVDHEEPGALRQLVQERTAGLPREAWLLQLAAYVLDVSVAEESSRTAEHPGGPQAVWLRQARTSLARALIVELQALEVPAA